MAQINPKAYLLLLVRLVLCGVFLMAALPKIQDPVAFAQSIEGFRVISAPFTGWVALLLPWLELVVGFGLLIPQIRRASALTISLLLLVFIGLHASAWIRGLDVNCGCFGASEASELPNYLWLILRNSALFLAASCILCKDWRNPLDRELTEDKAAS